MSDFKFQLGESVSDKVTGFEGAVIGRADHISGCNTYGVQPTQLKDGDMKEAKWFDEPRLASTGKPSLHGIDEREAKTGADSIPQPTR